MRKIRTYGGYFESFNGFQKKSKITPRNEIKKAKKIRKEYYETR